MKIEVYVKENVYCISCGIGVQRIKWLAQCAALKYDNNGMMKTGQPKGLKLADGTILNLNDRINEKLVDNTKLWLFFQDPVPDKKKDSKKK